MLHMRCHAPEAHRIVPSGAKCVAAPDQPAPCPKPSAPSTSLCAGPDAVRSLRGTVRKLQAELEEVKGSSKLERYSRLQKDLQARGRAMHPQNPNMNSSPWGGQLIGGAPSVRAERVNWGFRGQGPSEAVK